jgi:hypothetical protein
MSIGRPRALDETKQREVCALLSAGCSIREAARYVGCAANTIRREAQRNDDFNSRIRKAETYARLSPLHAMQRAVATHWRAAAWMLERSDPERFARRDPAAFHPKQAQALVQDVLRIIDSEILDPLKCERIQNRIRAVMNYAIRDVKDGERTGSNLRRAMKYLDEIDRGSDLLAQLGYERPYGPPKLSRDGPRNPDPPVCEALDRPATTADFADCIRDLANRVRKSVSPSRAESAPRSDEPLPSGPESPRLPPSTTEAQSP